MVFPKSSRSIDLNFICSTFLTTFKKITNSMGRIQESWNHTLTYLFRVTFRRRRSKNPDGLEFEFKKDSTGKITGYDEEYTLGSSFSQTSTRKRHSSLMDEEMKASLEQLPILAAEQEKILHKNSSMSRMITGSERRLSLVGGGEENGIRRLTMRMSRRNQLSNKNSVYIEFNDDMKKIESIIQSKYQHELVNDLLPIGGDFSVKIRFVSAVNKFLSTYVELDRLRKGLKIIEIFIIPETRFELLSLSKDRKARLLEGDISELAPAKNDILYSLSKRPEVMSLVDKFLELKNNINSNAQHELLVGERLRGESDLSLFGGETSCSWSSLSSLNTKFSTLNVFETESIVNKEMKEEEEEEEEEEVKIVLLDSKLDMNSIC